MTTLADVLVEINFHSYANEDWGEYANCRGLDFINKPDVQAHQRMERICRQCPVDRECHRWADRIGARGVFVAGEWRE